MESLKRPELLMSSTALITSLGTAVYTYRKVSENQTQIAELKEHLQSTVRRLADHQTVPATVRQVVEAIQQLNHAITSQSRDIQTIGRQLEDLTDRVANVEEGLSSLTEDVLENGIDVGNVFSVGRPKPKGKSSSRSGKKNKTVSFADRVNVAPSHSAPILTPSHSASTPTDNPLLDLTSTLPPVQEAQPPRSRGHSSRNPPTRRNRRRQPEPEPESEESEQDDGSDSEVLDDVIATVRNSRRQSDR